MFVASSAVSPGPLLEQLRQKLGHTNVRRIDGKTNILREHFPRIESPLIEVPFLAADAECERGVTDNTPSKELK